MQTINRNTFTTIHTEGAMLPADLLQRIAGGVALDGLTPEDYHLAPSEKLNEAINRSWNRLLGVWSASRRAAARAVPETDTGATLTRERWLLPCSRSWATGGLARPGGGERRARSYPISHNWQERAHPPGGLRVDLDNARPARRARAQPAQPAAGVPEPLRGRPVGLRLQRAAPAHPAR